MTLNLQMEQFSLAYIRAIASQAGYRIGTAHPDWDSVDGILIADWGRRPRIEFQAKSTRQDIIQDDHLRFRLDMDNYNQLRMNSTIPCILIVLRMPDEKHQWINQTEDELCLRHCAYWVSLLGHPAVPNIANITVRLPLSNVFNGAQLHALMHKVERGEAL